MAASNADVPNGEAIGESEGGESADPSALSTRGVETAVRCPYCDRPFPERRLQTLHCGLEHPDRLSERERAAFERAYLEEEAEIRRFRLYALGTLVLVYFLLLFLYAFVT